MTAAKDADDAVLRVVQHHAHALPHPPQARAAGARPAAGSRVPRHDVDHDELVGDRARLPRRARPRRRHHRHVLHRQRAAHEHLARRRHDAVPQREELQLGGRLPGAGDGALARPHPGRAGAQRDRQPQRLVRHAAGRGRRPRHRRPAPGGRRPRRARPTRSTSTGTTSSPTSPARSTRARGSTSSTSPTTATSPRCATTTGSSSSWSSARPGTLQVWAEPFTELRVPEDLQPAHRPVRAGRHHVEHLLRLDARPRLDPSSRRRRTWPRCCQTLVEFPPRQEPASFNIDKVMAKLRAGVAST